MSTVTLSQLSSEETEAKVGPTSYTVRKQSPSLGNLRVFAHCLSLPHSFSRHHSPPQGPWICWKGHKVGEEGSPGFPFAVGNLTLGPDGHFVLRQHLGGAERAAAAQVQPCRALRPPFPDLFSLLDFPRWRGQDTWGPRRESDLGLEWGNAGEWQAGGRGHCEVIRLITCQQCVTPGKGGEQGCSVEFAGFRESQI